MKRSLFCLCAIMGSLNAPAQVTFRTNPFEFVDSIQAACPKREIKGTSEELIVTYTFDQYNVWSENIFPNTYTFHIDGFEQNHDGGRPSFPITTDSFIIPAGKRASVSMIDSSYVDYNIELSPSIPLFTEWEDVRIPPISPFNGFFPKSNIISSKIREYRGYELLDICMTPLKYNYANKTVRLYKTISYKITWLRSSVDGNKTHCLPCDYSLNQVHHQNLYPRQQNDTIQTTEDYLIITTNKFENAARKFMEWKRTMGFRTHLIVQQSWNATNLKQAIRAVYEDPEKNLQYLLFIGDEDDIPPFQYIYYNDHLSFPVDLDYSCMGGANDTEADIFMGRISVHTNSEALVVINKIINYEKEPIVDDSFYNSALLSTYFQAESFDTEQKSRSYAKTTEDIRNVLADLGKTTYRVYNANDSVYPHYWYDDNNKVPLPIELQDTSVWRGNASDVINKINDGVAFVLHRDHGWEFCWPYINFSTTNIETLNNGRKLPVVFCIDCQCGQINHSEDCFAEAFLKKEQGGCVAMIAASGVTYSSSNNKMARNVVKAIWPSTREGTQAPIYRMGGILKQSLSGINDISSKRYYMCFGDPSMRIYSQPPTPFNMITIDRRTDSIIVRTDDVHSQIAFYDRSTGDVISFHGTYAKSNMVGNDVTVCVSAPNKITFLEDVNDSIYIQNEVVSGTKTYRAKKISVGSNVTDNKPQGPVLISGEKISLIGKEIELRNNTTISSGTILEIFN